MESNERVLIDENKKALIREAFDIDLNSDLFDPRFDYVAKRVLTAETPDSKLALIDLLNSAISLVNGEPVIDLTCLSQLSVSINSRVVLSQNRRVMRPK